MDLPIEVSERLDEAARRIAGLDGHVMDVLALRKPLSAEEALGWAGIVSKLSPLLGNLLEFEIVRLLNDMDLPSRAEWVRQDPGFPDAALIGMMAPPPGIELKAWFGLATEITARFKESQIRLLDGSVRVAVICWLPEYVLFGRPQVLGTWVESALSLAQARDNHYFNPPHYLVREPEDTSQRTINLQQTVTNGFRIQEVDIGLAEAVAEVSGWPAGLRTYSTQEEVQAKTRELVARFNYRLDTNYAKIDRVGHPGLEQFKERMLSTKFHGKTLLGWSQALSRTPKKAAEEIMEIARRAPD